MSEYIGAVGQKITVEVTYKKRFTYTATFGYRYIDRNVFKFEDADGNCIVWNTTSWIEDKHFVDNDGMCKIITEGSKLIITATVKEHSEYKGTKQTLINRPTFKLIELAKTEDEIRQEKAEAQKATIGENDFIWEMPYKQYKEHYSDCETVAGSFDDHCDSRGVPNGHPTIKVIIRAGRLKNSGVRGKRFHGFRFRSVELDPQSGKPFAITIRAVSEENALKQLAKDPETKGYTWELYTIYK